MLKSREEKLVEEKMDRLAPEVHVTVFGLGSSG